MSFSQRFLSFSLILAGLIAGCSQTEQESGSEKNTIRNESPRIAVTSWPLLEMTRTVVGDAASVVLVVPENTSSRVWSPTADDARTLQNARLILINGAGYEPWKDHLSLPGSRLRDTATGYYDQFIRIPDAVTHQHGPDGRHSHPGTVWATWLDPDLCLAQLHQLSLDCGRLIPDRRAAFETAEAKLAAEFSDLNSAIEHLKIASTTKENREIVVFSDSSNYQYLIRRLRWTLRYLHWGAVDPLSDSDRAEFQDTLKDSGTTNAWIFLMDSRRSTETEAFVSDSGGIVVRIDLCENVSPESHSLLARLKENLLRLEEGMRKCIDTEGNKVFFRQN